MYMARLSLKEIAESYEKTPKTFRKIVKDTGVPHELVGRSMFFDAGKVSAFFEALAAAKIPKPNIVKMPVRLPRNANKGKVVKFESKFSEAVG